MYYNKILGGIVGDIVGSTRERKQVKSEDFELFPMGSRFTDDTVMTLAVAEWLMTDPEHTESRLIECMRHLGRKYPDAGYGGMFCKWLESDNPRPYGSFGNGSAMRVSPVGMYANSMEEALELARITASVTHNHPEGIKGAQAIAASIYLKRTEQFDTEGKIRRYVEKHFGYDLHIDLREIRDEYSFDASCQGSVPIAIIAFLQEPYNAEKAIRLAISMGGDSDTIGCMTASIATAERPFCISSSSLSHDIEDRCRELLPPDLLAINDRFMAFINRPLHQSYEVSVGPEIIYAGEYPGDKNNESAKQKIKHMVHFGVRHFIDLTEEGELRPYAHLLPEEATYYRFPIKDCGVPKSVDDVYQLLHRIDELKQQEGYIYIHCWGGIGRTGTIIACYLAKQLKKQKLDETLQALRNQFSEMPKSAYRKTPETKEQLNFIEKFINSLNSNKDVEAKRIADCIRGSLMAGAAGDALGYEVEFMSRRSILSKYGPKGITTFELDPHGKALVSDDTQMTLFTANGMLMGITRGYMRGIGGRPENYVAGAYLDWYYTQTGRKKVLMNDWHYTWLRDLPELAHRRAPGNTCLRACESLFNNREVNNDSKGCGGIMRVAPMGLLLAGYMARDRRSPYSIPEMFEAGAEIARVTHQHPLGFLPAGMMTELLFKLVPLSPTEAKERICEIARDTINTLNEAFRGQYKEDKHYLAELTRKAIRLAQSDIEDNAAINELGEGWTGEEAWAIALFCAIRHIDSMRDAIIASVNHNGDSDSTGSVCGNIMGAIYGYNEIKRQRLFCPEGKEFEETIELADIILAIADDLTTSCIINEYSPIDTPSQKQWYARYCKMQPWGLK